MTAFTPLAWFDPFDLICSLQRRMGMFRNSVIWLIDPDRRIDLGKWPEAERMLENIRGLGGEQWEAEHAWVDLLEPQDAHPLVFCKHLRLYMPLRTNPHAPLQSPGCVDICPLPGALVAIHKPYVAWNLGDSPRIALIIDAKPRGP